MQVQGWGSESAFRDGGERGDLSETGKQTGEISTVMRQWDSRSWSEQSLMLEPRSIPSESTVTIKELLKGGPMGAVETLKLTGCSEESTTFWRPPEAQWSRDMSQVQNPGRRSIQGGLSIGPPIEIPRELCEFVANFNSSEAVSIGGGTGYLWGCLANLKIN